VKRVLGVMCMDSHIVKQFQLIALRVNMLIIVQTCVFLYVLKIRTISEIPVPGFVWIGVLISMDLSLTLLLTLVWKKVIYMLIIQLDFVYIGVLIILALMVLGEIIKLIPAFIVVLLVALVIGKLIIDIVWKFVQLEHLLMNLLRHVYHSVPPVHRTLLNFVTGHVSWNVLMVLGLQMKQELV
jgi:hypothetical protein